jgi:hypothetical protein
MRQHPAAGVRAYFPFDLERSGPADARWWVPVSSVVRTSGMSPIRSCARPRPTVRSDRPDAAASASYRITDSISESTSASTSAAVRGPGRFTLRRNSRDVTTGVGLSGLLASTSHPRIAALNTVLAQTLAIAATATPRRRRRTTSIHPGGWTSEGSKPLSAAIRISRTSDAVVHAETRATIRIMGCAARKPARHRVRRFKRPAM